MKQETDIPRSKVNQEPITISAKRLLFIFLIIILLIPFSLRADWFSLDGYYKNFTTILDFPRYTMYYYVNPPLMGLVLSRLRLDANFKLNHDFSFDFLTASCKNLG